MTSIEELLPPNFFQQEFKEDELSKIIELAQNKRILHSVLTDQNTYLHTLYGSQNPTSDIIIPFDVHEKNFLFKQAKNKFISRPDIINISFREDEIIIYPTDFKKGKHETNLNQLSEYNLMTLLNTKFLSTFIEEIKKENPNKQVSISSGIILTPRETRNPTNTLTANKKLAQYLKQYTQKNSLNIQNIYSQITQPLNLDSDFESTSEIKINLVNTNEVYKQIRFIKNQIKEKKYYPHEVQAITSWIHKEELTPDFSFKYEPNHKIETNDPELKKLEQKKQTLETDLNQTIDTFAKRLYETTRKNFLEDIERRIKRINNSIERKEEKINALNKFYREGPKGNTALDRIHNKYREREQLKSEQEQEKKQLIELNQELMKRKQELKKDAWKHSTYTQKGFQKIYTLVDEHIQNLEQEIEYRREKQIERWREDEELNKEMDKYNKNTKYNIKQIHSAPKKLYLILNRDKAIEIQTYSTKKF